MTGATPETLTEAVIARDLELAAADAAARRRACECFDAPLVVEAGAGTGKTTTLIARIATWCTGPGWQRAHAELAARAGSREGSPIDARVPVGAVARRVLDGLVVITFTEAASAEMGRRLALAFAELERGALPRGMHADLLSEDSRARAAALSDALERPVVSTIHAWCKSLLAEFPLEAGLDPGFTVDADGVEIADACRAALEARLRTALGDPPDEDYLLLARRGFGPHRIEEALLALARAGTRARDLAEDPLAPSRNAEFLAELAGRCTSFVAGFEAELARAAGRSKTSGEVQALLGDLAARARAPGSATLLGLQAFCDGARARGCEAARARLADWARGKLNGSERAALAGAAESLSLAAKALAPLVEAVWRLEPLLLDAGRRVLRLLLADVEARMRARGVEGFADLLRDARDLLRDHPDVRRRVRRRVRQICVDEFQDTDPLQCDLVRWLALEGEPGRQGEPRPGIFLVGDPKQSIYGWRSADLGAYERFVGELLAAGGECVRLSVNHRSTHAILRAVERIVAPVMSETRGVQPAFEPLVPARDDAGVPVELWVSWELDPKAQRRLHRTRNEDASAIEARMVARDLASAHAAGLAFGDAAILLRSGSTLETYLAALREAGIPYEVTGDRSYFRRREVIDAAALVRCVIDPTDHLALLTVLRSAWVGTPDAALLPLWSESFPALVTDLDGEGTEALAAIELAIARAAERVSAEAGRIPGLDRIEGWPAVLAHAVRVLGRLRAAFREEPADVFVEELRVLSCLEASEAARYLGAHRVANLERFFGRLLAGLEKDGGNARALLRALKHALSEQQDAEEARPKDDDEARRNAVQVMTIHKSKGLDFERVYLVAMHRGHGRDALPFAELDVRSNAAELALFGTASPGWRRVEARRRETEAAERVRTLYVAMTRAKERLVLAGSWPEEPRARDWRACSTHLELCASAFAGTRDLGARLLACAEDDERRIEVEETRFVLPPLQPIEIAVEPGPARARVDLAAIEREHALLARRAGASATRMARVHAGTIAPSGEIERTASGAEDAGAVRVAAPRTADEGRRAALLAGLRCALLDPDLPLGLEHARARIAAALPAGMQEEARELCERFLGGPLGRRLSELRARGAALDVPLQIAVESASDDPLEPTGSLAARVDVAWSDEPGGRARIALWTLGPPTEEGGDRSGEADGEQCTRGRSDERRRVARIAAAWREALGLEQDPVCELWRLEALTLEVLGAEGLPIS